MCQRYLYDEDGRPVGRILGYDPDGGPEIEDWLADDLGRFDRVRADAGEILGPADPADAWEEIAWHDWEPPDLDFDEEADDPLGDEGLDAPEDAGPHEPPASADLDWLAEQDRHDAHDAA